MEFIKNNKVVIISVICLILMLGSVVLWNELILKQSEKNIETNQVVPVGKVNNVSSVEAKFGEDIKITQEYLLNYTSNKASIWYMSNAIVKKIKKIDTLCEITLNDVDDKEISLIGTIDVNKCDIKAGDVINFVGTLDIESGNIELSKISTEKINYKNVTEINFSDLVENIKNLKSNYFIVIGYMVTEGDKYKLFDSKDSYKENNSAGNYFLISWKEQFMYTGNQKVTLKCLIEDTYKLNMCELVE